MENREEFLGLLPEGTEIVSETDEGLYTIFVVKHNDLPEVATEHGAEVPEISPVIRSVLTNPKKAETYEGLLFPVYRYEWDWNLE